jgi:hypothetical protein
MEKVESEKWTSIKDMLLNLYTTHKLDQCR